MKALVTGSGGLIGSECVRLLGREGWHVIGVDNDLRRQFFGEAGTTRRVVEDLIQSLTNYRHFNLDIRNRQAIRDLLETEHPDFIIHSAAQPSHDKAASIPYDDFDVNAVGTMNLLVAARDFCRESPFCFTSTNKVYGDRPNSLELMELDRRYDYSDGKSGSTRLCLSITVCTQSLAHLKLLPTLCVRSLDVILGCLSASFAEGALPDPSTPAWSCTDTFPTSLIAQSPAGSILSLDTRANRSAIRFIVMTWLSCFWPFFTILLSARSSILEEGGLTAFRFSRPLTCWPISAFRSTMNTRMTTALVIISVIFPT